jgi:hypothetical protein
VINLADAILNARAFAAETLGVQGLSEAGRPAYRDGLPGAFGAYAIDPAQVQEGFPAARDTTYTQNITFYYGEKSPDAGDAAWAVRRKVEALADAFTMYNDAGLWDVVIGGIAHGGSDAYEAVFGEHDAGYNAAHVMVSFRLVAST